MEKGLIVVSTLDNFEELGRFLYSFKQHNSFPVHVIVAKDIVDAHRAKTRCAFHSPFKFTIMIDTDILINGDLSELFKTAEQGFIGIVREKLHPVLNSGVVVFPTELMKEVCTLWNSRYEEKILNPKTKGKRSNLWYWDQDILNEILPQFPYKELPSIFNQILHDYTPEEELKIYDKIKVFHFLHHSNIDRYRYKSYKNYMAIKPFELE